jgi:TonB family protein
MSRIILLVSVFLLTSIRVNAQTPLQVDWETAAQHLLNHPKAIYPPIARASHIYGTVTMQTAIDQAGHVTSVHALSGPPMLSQAAIDAVRQYTYMPFQQNAKPVDATTIVSINFSLNGPPDLGDEKAADQFFQLFVKCGQLVGQNAAPCDQVETCQKTAQRAETFPPDTRLNERRAAYVYYAMALMRDGKASDARAAGDKAIAFVKRQPNNPAGASAAYEVTGEALTMAGDLAGADKDLTMAENYERKALHATSGHPMNNNYSQVLKAMLQFHAKILSQMGNQKEAQQKLEQASKL